MSDEAPANRQLGEAMMLFFSQVVEYMQTKDDVMRQVHTETYREAVLRAAEAGFENSLAWHALGTWTEEGKERIGCFSRALDALEREPHSVNPVDARGHWCVHHTRASCLYEIARVHGVEGAPEVALGFLARALPEVREAEEWASRVPEVKPDGLGNEINALRQEMEEKAGGV